MKKIVFIITLFVSLCHIGVNNTWAVEASPIIPIDNDCPESKLFQVSVNEVKIPTGEFSDISYCSFIQKGEASVSVKFKEKILECTVSPLNKKIEVKRIGTNEIQFKLKDASYIVVTLNKSERVYLFAEKNDFGNNDKYINITKYLSKGNAVNTAAIQKAINETASKRQTLFFPAGVYVTGKLNIPSNTKMFLAPGAVIKASDDLEDLRNDEKLAGRGFIRIQNAENVEIKGLGTFDGNGRKLRDKYADQARMRIFLIVSSKNITIEGVIARNPGSWNTQIRFSDLVDLRNVKLLNDVTLSNTDGFDPDASSRITIENCFAYCGDDNVAIKVTEAKGAINKTSDIVVRGCVFLTRKSSLKVGTESRGTSISNVLFENNDVVMSDRGMALYSSDGAVYENIRYINNRFETNYPDSKRMGIQFVINKRNANSVVGLMKDILIKDCLFYQSFPKASEIKGMDDRHTISVKIENLIIEGQRCENLEAAGITTAHANVSIK